MTTEDTPTNPRRVGRKSLLIGAAVLASAIIAGSMLTIVPAVVVNAQNSTQNVSDGYQAPSSAEISKAPAAIYNAVIAGLDSAPPVDATKVTTAYTTKADLPIYGSDRKSIVARIPAKNFLDKDSVIVPISTSGAWSQILTPARQKLPSTTNNAAPAQTVGWVRTDQLTKAHSLLFTVSVSVSAQSLTISRGNADSITYPVGVGDADTPTPTDVTGFLQAQYLDPAQNQSLYPIQLSSLHSSAADEPFQGSDGGLIGLHYNGEATGKISHGCIRGGPTVIAALNMLPVGTLISIVA